MFLFSNLIVFLRASLASIIWAVPIKLLTLLTIIFSYVKTTLKLIFHDLFDASLSSSWFPFGLSFANFLIT